MGSLGGGSDHWSTATPTCVPFATLGGSWVVRSGVPSPLLWVIIMVTLLMGYNYGYPTYNRTYN